MKYGILTFHNIPNFGAMMQAYALCKSIRLAGQDCEIIDYQCENIIKRELTYHPLKNKAKDLVMRTLAWPKQKKKIQVCDKFMQDQHMFSSQRYFKSTIKEANAVYDCFVSGSDMIWNMEVTGNDLTYFLDFVEKDKRRFSYGSSIGAKWTPSVQKCVKPMLSKYDMLGTREEDTCNVIQQELGLKCEWTCDPTMLLEPDVWKEMSISPREKNYVLVYFPYNDILNAAKRYAAKHNKQILVLNWNIPKMGVKNISPNTPAEWIGYIRCSDAVFTDSYHGVLFSLYFQKQVWTNNRSNRVGSLLHDFHLESCFIENDAEFKTNIDYSACSPLIAEKRKKSLGYIHNMIEMVEERD